MATPVVEAGFGDLDASLLITETAPWPSLVLRAGHGKRGEVLWVPPPSGHVSAPGHPPAADHRAVIQPSQLVTLFDTSTYRSDDDIDIAPYLRDAEDLDAEVAWATWTPGADGAPDPEVRLPLAEHRCRIGLAEALRLAEGRAVWRFDWDAGAWTPVTGQPPSRLRPGELLLVNAADGGYDTETGLDPLARALVPDSPVLLTPDEQAPSPAGAPPGPAAGEGTEGDPGPASAAPRRWQSLDEHSEQVRDQVAALLAAIAPPGLPPAAARSAVIAGWLHDVGKAHPIWQDALCALAEADERDKITAGRPWAKSGVRTGRLEFAGDVQFRHELASLLLIDDSLGDLLSQAPDQDLARFLVVAHHGKLRVQIREPAAPDAVGGGEPALSALSQIRGLRQGARWPIPPMLGHPASTLTVDLGQFTSDGHRSWTNVVLSLLARYGPFTLAYLETIVRVADWRASGGRELAQPKGRGRAVNDNAIDIHAKARELRHNQPGMSLPTASPYPLGTWRRRRRLRLAPRRRHPPRPAPRAGQRNYPERPRLTPPGPALSPGPPKAPIAETGSATEYRAAARPFPFSCQAGAARSRHPPRTPPRNQPHPGRPSPGAPPAGETPP